MKEQTKDINNCLNCGAYPKLYSKRPSIEYTSYIKCPVCGRRTLNYSAFWMSDADDKAKDEWNKLNPEY